jgi:nicotinate-nucleotide adenylyltransferase
LAQREEIDRILVVPAYLNPFKQTTVASAQQRLSWCQTVFDHPRVTVDESEVRSNQPVYTIDTFRRLSDAYDLRYIAIGSDNLDSLARWRDFEQLNRAVTWLVFERSGHDAGYEKLRRYERIALDEPISSTHIRTQHDWSAIDPRIVDDVKSVLKTHTPPKETHDFTTTR